MTQTAQETQGEIERTIVNLLEAGMEETDIPDAIAAYADKRVGKPVTVKDAEALERQLGVHVRISKRFGMTSVAWTRTTWNAEDGSILISHDDTNVRWPDSATIQQKGVAHFAAAKERNTKRRALLAEHKTMRDALGPGVVPSISDQSIIYRTALAVRQLREAHETLQKLIDWGELMHVAKYDIEKLVGIK